MQTADQRQIVDQVQNVDWESKEFFPLVCDNVSFYNLPSVTQSLFCDQANFLIKIDLKIN